MFANGNCEGVEFPIIIYKLSAFNVIKKCVDSLPQSYTEIIWSK